MENKVSVLIVEDEGVVALGLEDTLRTEGYDVAAVADNGKEALEIIRRKIIDLVLLDIRIKGEWDGIETARRLTAVKNIPFIYLTAFSDDETVERARGTVPSAYLVKPYQPRNLLIAIDLAMHHFMSRREGAAARASLMPARPLRESPEQKDTVLFFNEAIFIKQNYKFVKVNLADICYFEADGNHTKIHAGDKMYLIRRALGTMLEKLNRPVFVRVHRSFAVSIRHIVNFNECMIRAGDREIPLGRHYKDDFFRHFEIL